MLQRNDPDYYVNVPYILARHLAEKGRGVEARSKICGGHFVTRIMRRLRLYSDAASGLCSHRYVRRYLTPGLLRTAGITHGDPPVLVAPTPLPTMTHGSGIENIVGIRQPEYEQQQQQVPAAAGGGGIGDVTLQDLMQQMQLRDDRRAFEYDQTRQWQMSMNDSTSYHVNRWSPWVENYGQGLYASHPDFSGQTWIPYDAPQLYVPQIWQPPQQQQPQDDGDEDDEEMDEDE